MGFSCAIQWPLSTTASLTGAKLKKIFELYRNGAISREGIYMAMSGAVPLDRPPAVPSGDEIGALIRRAADGLRSISLHNPAKTPHVLTGLVMDELRGRVAGAAVAAKVREFLEGRA